MEQASGQEMASARRGAMRTVLAAGSDRAALNEMARRLGNLGYLVVLSDSGGQALELISARGFDMVLLDTLAPEHAGLHVLHEVRGARATEDLPVVLLTESADKVVQAFDAGADECLVKPVDFVTLSVRIERLLRHAARVDELKRANLALDARIASRAIELGEARAELAAARADRTRLIASVRTLHDELAIVRKVAGPGLSARTSVAG